MKRLPVYGLLALAVVMAGTLSMEAKLEPGTYAHFTTSLGKFTVKLADQDAPKTVANFVGLAEGTKEWTDPKSGQKVKKPYYEGLVFHRVIDGFMIQGGDPLGVGTGGPGYRFEDEFSPKQRHSKEGILSMANAGPEHERRPVLHHPRPHAAPRQQALGVRRSGRRHGRGSQDRQGADRRRQQAGDARDDEREDRAGQVAGTRLGARG